MYSVYKKCMQVLVKPNPNEKFYQLSAKQAGVVAMQMAKEAGNGQTDWEVFREWTSAWRQRNRTRNLTLA